MSKKMKVLFKTLHGSKLYGTDTPSSDTDYKVVYLPDLDDVILGRRFQNFKETTASDKVKNGPEDVETEFIALQTFAKDFYEGQTYALEIAFSALSKVESHQTFMIDSAEEGHFMARFVSDLVSKFLMCDVSKMIGYAYHQASVYSVKGARLETLEHFTHYVKSVAANYGNTSDLKIDVLMPWVEGHADQYLFMTEVENAKGGMASAPAISILGKLITASTPFNHAVKMLDSMLDRYGERAKQAKASEGYDWKAISHAIRVTMQALELLTRGKITLPFNTTDVTLLKNIKAGKMSWPLVESLFKDLLDKVDAAKQHSTLPERSDATDEAFEAFMLEHLKVYFYRLGDN